MHNLNLSIFHFINTAVGYYQGLDFVMIFITTYLSYAVTIGIGIYICFWVPLQNESLERLRSMGRALELILASFLTWFVVQAIKIISAQPRPFQALVDVRTLIPDQSGYSFPSAHAALTFAVATIVYFYHRRLGVFLFVFAVIVSVSRIYVGVHYPADVLVGVLLGVSISYLIHKIFSQITKNKVQ